MISGRSTARRRVLGASVGAALLAVAASPGTPAGARVTPSARSRAVAATDGKTVMLFGGLTGGFALGETTANDTWAWNGTSWIERITPTAPPSRQGAAMAYDATNKTVVLFGGDSGCCTRLNDTWTWDVVGKAWTQQIPATLPPPRSGATMAYDPVTGRVVMFGGHGPPTNSLGDSPVVFDDTWTWDGTRKTWTPETPSVSPPGRSLAAMSTVGNQVVLFGGMGGVSSPDLGDTWTWDGQAGEWTERRPPVSPSARHGAAAAYHPPTSSVVLFGGSAAGQALDDTWTWNGAKWKPRAPTNSPPPRLNAAMAHHRPSATTMLFGGEIRQSNLGDTWAWNGTNWKPR